MLWKAQNLTVFNIFDKNKSKIKFDMKKKHLFYFYNKIIQTYIFLHKNMEIEMFITMRIYRLYKNILLEIFFLFLYFE